MTEIFIGTTSKEHSVFSDCVNVEEYAIETLMSLREILTENGADTERVWAPEQGGGADRGQGQVSTDPAGALVSPDLKTAIQCHLGFLGFTNAKEIHAHPHGL